MMWDTITGGTSLGLVGRKVLPPTSSMKLQVEFLGLLVLNCGQGCQCPEMV